MSHWRTSVLRPLGNPNLTFHVFIALMSRVHSHLVWSCTPGSLASEAYLGGVFFVTLSVCLIQCLLFMHCLWWSVGLKLNKGYDCNWVLWVPSGHSQSSHPCKCILGPDHLPTPEDKAFRGRTGVPCNFVCTWQALARRELTSACALPLAVIRDSWNHSYSRNSRSLCSQK